MEFTGERVVPGKMPDHVHVLQEHLARYVFALGFIKPGDKVLDIACGTGYGTMMLHWRSPWNVWGADRSEDAVFYAEEMYPGRFAVADIEDPATWVDLLSHARDFDVIVSFETVEHVDPDKYLHFVRGALKPGGTVILSTPLNPGRKPQNPHHKFEWDGEQFGDWLHNNFSEISRFGQNGIDIEHTALFEERRFCSDCAAGSIEKNPYTYGIAVGKLKGN